MRKFGMAPLMKVPATTIRKVFMPVGWCSVGRNVLFSTQKTEMQIKNTVNTIDRVLTFVGIRLNTRGTFISARKIKN